MGKYLEKFLLEGLAHYHGAGEKTLDQVRENITTLATKDLTKLPKTIQLNGISLSHKYEKLTTRIELMSRLEKSPAGNTQLDALSWLSEGNNLLLLGGPGTGKSYTIERFIDSLQKGSRKSVLHISIATPTGKAAARYEKIKSSSNTYVTTGTIHRLMQYNPKTLLFTDTIDVDILVIDEVSMVDFELLAELIAMTPATTQIIFAGDLNQLPPVDGHSCRAIFDFLLAENRIGKVELTAAQRFSAAHQLIFERARLGGLAEIKRNLANESTDILKVKTISVRELPAALKEYAKESSFFEPDFKELRLRAGKLPWHNMTNADLVEVQSIQKILMQQILLTLTRSGMTGSISLNGEMLSLLYLFFQSRNETLFPVIATQNNYRLNLFNGDPGFIIEIPGEPKRLVFPSDIGVRVVLAADFHKWEYSFALTVHKAQGSEYEDVWIILSQNDKSLQQENALLYTAVTRTRATVKIFEII